METIFIGVGGLSVSLGFLVLLSGIEVGGNAGSIIEVGAIGLILVGMLLFIPAIILARRKAKRDDALIIAFGKLGSNILSELKGLRQDLKGGGKDGTNKSNPS